MGTEAKQRKAVYFSGFPRLFDFAGTRLMGRVISASSLAENSSQILTCSSTGLPAHRSSTSRASRSSQRGITLRLLVDAADFIAVALPSVQDKGYAQYGYNYYRHDYSNQRAASYIHNIIAA